MQQQQQRERGAANVCGTTPTHMLHPALSLSLSAVVPYPFAADNSAYFVAYYRRMWHPVLISTCTKAPGPVMAYGAGSLGADSTVVFRMCLVLYASSH